MFLKVVTIGISEGQLHLLIYNNFLKTKILWNYEKDEIKDGIAW